MAEFHSCHDDTASTGCINSARERDAIPRNKLPNTSGHAVGGSYRRLNDFLCEHERKSIQ